MKPFFYLKNFSAALLILIVLDVIWLGLVMNKFNIDQMGGLARIKNGSMDPLKVPAALTYVFMAIAVTAFAAPSNADGSWYQSIGVGALLGLCIYGILDLTNLAIIKDYPAQFAIADIAWGVTSYGLTNVILFSMRKWLA